MPIKRAWATCAFAVACCAASTVVLVSGTGHATTARDYSPRVRLGDADDGRSVHVLPGTRIEVELRPNAQGGYRAPTTDRPDVLREDSRGEDDPGPGEAHARFVAAAPGYATITSDRDAACGQFLECDTAAHPYRVHVAVDHSPEDSPAG